MKKIILIVLFLTLIIPLSSCNEVPKKTTTITTDVESSKILIAYFSWADNVTQFDINDLDVDAYTGASLSVPGNGEIVARYIQDEVGGVLHKIIVSNPYSPVYDECLARARTELSNNERPELKSVVEDFDSYEYIFLGFPNWWNKAPRAVLTFIDSYDFENKTVIPFCMHGTSGKSSPVNEVEDYLPNGTTVMNSIGVYRPETLNSRSDVIVWLESLGFNNEETEDQVNS